MSRIKKFSRKKSTKKFKRNREDFDSPEYREWARQVKERDKNRCQMPGCKKHHFSIQCHHIIKWSDQIWSRYNVMNGICLCETHHRMITGHEGIWAPLFIKIVHANTLKQIGWHE